MTLSSGAPVFGLAASFAPVLTAGLLLCSWENSGHELQIENVNMAETIHFEKRMCTNLFLPGVTPEKDRPTRTPLQVGRVS